MDFFRSVQFVVRFGWPYLRRYRARFFAGIGLGVAFGVSNSLFVWLSALIVERLQPAESSGFANSALQTSGGSVLDKLNAHLMPLLDPLLPRMGEANTMGQILLLPFTLLVLTTLRGVLGYLSTYCLMWVNEHVMCDLRCDVLEKLQSLSVDYFNRSRIGDMTTRINQDTANLHQALYLGLSDLVKEPATIVGILLALFLQDWKLTLMALLFVPMVVVPVAVLGQKMRKASADSVRTLVDATSLLIEALRNVRIVKAFGLESHQEREFRKHQEQYASHSMRMIRASELVNPVMETLVFLGVGLILAFAFAQSAQPRDLAALVVGIGMLLTPVKKLAKLHILFQRARASTDRMHDLFSEQPSTVEKSSAVTAPPFAHSIECRNLSFSYGAEDVICDLNLTIRKGEKIGIAGESGSGKSTLINLIYRFYDVRSGSILLDGANIRDLSIASLRSQMALVSQEVLLFNSSVAENIALGKLGASIEEVQQAAMAAQAHEFINALPDGYHTVIGETGLRLSGGQRQRLAIARALVRNAPILLLDEATASLDSESEAEVQATIDRLSRDRTVITVAHRLSTLRLCDRILVFQKGRVVEQGSWADLMKPGTRFHEMANRQGIPC